MIAVWILPIRPYCLHPSVLHASVRIACIRPYCLHPSVLHASVRTLACPPMASDAFACAHPDLGTWISNELRAYFPASYFIDTDSSSGNFDVSGDNDGGMFSDLCDYTQVALQSAFEAADRDPKLHNARDRDAFVESEVLREIGELIDHGQTEFVRALMKHIGHDSHRQMPVEQSETSQIQQEQPQKNDEQPQTQSQSQSQSQTQSPSIHSQQQHQQMPEVLQRQQSETQHQKRTRGHRNTQMRGGGRWQNQMMARNAFQQQQQMQMQQQRSFALHGTIREEQQRRQQQIVSQNSEGQTPSYRRERGYRQMRHEGQHHDREGGAGASYNGLSHYHPFDERFGYQQGMQRGEYYQRHYPQQSSFQQNGPGYHEIPFEMQSQQQQFYYQQNQQPQQYMPNQSRLQWHPTNGHLQPPIAGDAFIQQMIPRHVMQPLHDEDMSNKQNDEKTWRWQSLPNPTPQYIVPREPPPGEDACSLFLHDVPSEFNNIDDLSSWFEHFGPIIGVKVISERSASVDFKTQEAAKNALSSTQAVFGDCNVRISWSKIQRRRQKQRKNISGPVEGKKKRITNGKSGSLKDSESSAKASILITAEEKAAEILAMRSTQSEQSNENTEVATKSADKSDDNLVGNLTEQSVGAAFAKRGMLSSAESNNGQSDAMIALRQKLIDKYIEQQKALMTQLQMQKDQLTAESRAEIVSKVKSLQKKLTEEVEKQSASTATTPASKRMRTEPASDFDALSSSRATAERNQTVVDHYA